MINSKQALIVAFLVGFAGHAHAETCSLAQAASLDMNWTPSGRFTVPVSVNGKTLQFMVDTAGVFSELSETAAQELKLEPKGTGNFMYGVNGKIPIRMVKADSFMVGPNNAKDFHFVLRSAAKEGDVQVDGVLSSDFLTLFDVEIDSAHKKFNLFSQDHCAGKVVYWTRDAYAEIPFHLSGDALHISRDNHIDLTAQLDGHDVSTEFDTGSAMTWLRLKSAKLIMGIDESSPGMEKVSEAGANSLAVYRKHFGAISLGGLMDKDPAMVIIDDKEEDAFRMEHSEKSRDDPVYGAEFQVEDLTLGMSVISKMRIYIAYKEHKIYATGADAH